MVDTRLHTAVMRGDETAAGELLECGAYIDAGGRWANTALDGAVQGRHKTIVERLLRRGEDVNAEGGEMKPHCTMQRVVRRCQYAKYWWEQRQILI